MSTENNQTTDNQAAEKGKRPTHTAKIRHGHGKQATYEQIGVGWKNDKGGIYVKLHGTQIVSEFSLYEIKNQGTEA